MRNKTKKRQYNKYMNIISKEVRLPNRCTLFTLTFFFLEPPGADMARTSQGITLRHSTLPTYFLLRKRDKNIVKMF